MAVAELNEEIIAMVCTEIKRGVPLNSGCKIVGVSEKQFNKWLKKGERQPEDSDNIYRLLYDEVERAKALAIAYRVENLRKAEDAGDVQVSKWMLEHLDNEHFGKKSVLQQEVSGELDLNLSDLFDDDLVDKILDMDKNKEEEP